MLLDGVLWRCGTHLWRVAPNGTAQRWRTLVMPFDAKHDTEWHYKRILNETPTDSELGTKQYSTKSLHISMPNYTLFQHWMGAQYSVSRAQYLVPTDAPNDTYCVMCSLITLLQCQPTPFWCPSLLCSGILKYWANQSQILGIDFQRLLLLCSLTPKLASVRVVVQTFCSSAMQCHSTPLCPAVCPWAPQCLKMLSNADHRCFVFHWTPCLKPSIGNLFHTFAENVEVFLFSVWFWWNVDQDMQQEKKRPRDPISFGKTIKVLVTQNGQFGVGQVSH